jgi:hypothetical protein
MALSNGDSLRHFDRNGYFYQALLMGIGQLACGIMSSREDFSVKPHSNLARVPKGCSGVKCRNTDWQLKRGTSGSLKLRAMR